MPHEDIQNFRANTANVLAVLCVHVPQNMLDENRDVVLMLAQGRQMDVKHIQAEVEILAQLSAAHSLFCIFVRRCQHTHVDRRFALAPQAAHFAILEDAQQFRLRRRRHLADFIEQQRSCVGKFEAADPAFRRAGECAALVAENLALHQGFRNRGTVDSHEGPAGPRRELVNRAGHNFFARPGLACDEYGRRARRSHFHDAHHFLHGLRRANEIA